MGRTSTARERLLAAACALMVERSYATVGVAELCTRADVRKGSFYYFFDSKQALTLAAIDLHWTSQRADWVATLSAPGPALSRLAQLFQDTQQQQRRIYETTGTVRGCVLANLALELAGEDAVIRERLRAIFDEQVELVRDVLAQAADTGSVPAMAADATTAQAVVAQLEGTLIFSRLANDPTKIEAAWPQAERLLRAAPTRT